MKTVKEWLKDRKKARQFKKEDLRDGTIVYWRLKDNTPFFERSIVSFFKRDGQEYYFFITKFHDDEIHVDVASSYNKDFMITLPINNVHDILKS